MSCAMSVWDSSPRQTNTLDKLFLVWAAPQQHWGTNSPWAWGFSFLAISLLTTIKLACVTLSWSARGLDKTACRPIKLGEWQLYPRALVLSTHLVLHVSRYNDAQRLSFRYCRSVPTNQAQGLAFHFHKEELIHLFILKRATLRTAPTFLFLLAIFRFNQRESPLVVVTCQSLRTRRDDTRWQLGWCCVQLPRSWPGKTATRHGGI